MSCEYLRKCSKKFETALMVYSGAWGKLIHEKNQKSKISGHCPFKAKNLFSDSLKLGQNEKASEYFYGKITYSFNLQSMIIYVTLSEYFRNIIHN